MSLHSAVATEVNRIRKSKDASSIIDVSYKKFSYAAISRIEQWLKRIATLVVTKDLIIAGAETVEVPRNMKSLLKRYICPSDDSARSVYFLFKQWLEHLLRYYRPKNPLSTTLTVDCVDQSIMDPNGPLADLLVQLHATRALPYLADKKSCSRRK